MPESDNVTFPIHTTYFITHSSLSDSSQSQHGAACRLSIGFDEMAVKV